jgi:hypothetical protein
VRKKSIILKFALLGLCFAVSFRTATGGDATKPAPKTVTATAPGGILLAAAPTRPEAGRQAMASFQSSKRKSGIAKFSTSDDALGRHVSRFSGPPGPTLTVPGATFLRSPLTPAQMGQLYSESLEISEGELLYDFPPGTALRKVVAVQTAQKN